MSATVRGNVGGGERGGGRAQNGAAELQPLLEQHRQLAERYRSTLQEVGDLELCRQERRLVVGGVLGFLVTWWATSGVLSLTVWGAQPSDPRLVTGVALLTAVGACAAGYYPARRVFILRRLLAGFGWTHRLLVVALLVTVAVVFWPPPRLSAYILMGSTALLLTVVSTLTIRSSHARRTRDYRGAIRRRLQELDDVSTRLDHLLENGASNLLSEGVTDIAFRQGFDQRDLSQVLEHTVGPIETRLEALRQERDRELQSGRQTLTELERVEAQRSSLLNNYQSLVCQLRDAPVVATDPAVRRLLLTAAIGVLAAMVGWWMAARFLSLLGSPATPAMSPGWIVAALLISTGAYTLFTVILRSSTALGDLVALHSIWYYAVAGVAGITAIVASFWPVSMTLTGILAFLTMFLVAVSLVTLLNVRSQVVRDLDAGLRDELDRAREQSSRLSRQIETLTSELHAFDRDTASEVASLERARQSVRSNVCNTYALGRSVSNHVAQHSRGPSGPSWTERP